MVISTATSRTHFCANLYYCDPALSSNLGHYATHMRLLNTAFRKLGFTVSNYVAGKLTEVIQCKEPVHPWFSASPYAQTSQDSYIGWMKSFQDISALLAKDLSRLNIDSKSSIVFFDAATPSALFSVIRYLSETGSDAPKIIVSLIEQSGMSVKDVNKQPYELVPASHSALLYRYCGLHLTQAHMERLSFITVDKTFAEVYSHLLNTQVHYVGHPYNPLNFTANPDETKNEITLGFVGAQRPQKGFQLVPGIVKYFLDTNPSIRFLIQDGRNEMKRELNQIREIAKLTDRVTLRESIETEESWQEVLSEIDLLVLPYDVSSYAIACSGISCEAIANAIPMVAPVGTTMERLAIEHNAAGVFYRGDAKTNIISAIHSAIEELSSLRHQARLARESWVRVNGSEHVASRIIKLARLA